MFFIDTTFNNNCKTPSDLMKALDKKIYQYSLNRLNDIRYGFSTKVEYNDFEDILIYKSILDSKINNDKCLCNWPLEVITSQIKKLINKIC